LGAILTLGLLLQIGRRYPSSSSEWWLCALLILFGLALAARLARPLLAHIRWLDRRGSLRGERGRRFLERMGWPNCYGGGLRLRGRDLRGEDLVDAFLSYADLSDTDLRGVDLRGADLEGAFLLGAIYDANTRWPEGFDPRKHGARRVD
jgi:hypothetical protein